MKYIYKYINLLHFNLSLAKIDKSTETPSNNQKKTETFDDNNIRKLEAMGWVFG